MNTEADALQCVNWSQCAISAYCKAWSWWTRIEISSQLKRVNDRWETLHCRIWEFHEKPFQKSPASSTAVWLRSTSTLGVRVQGEIKLQLYKITLLVEQLVRHTHISESHLMSFSNTRIPPFSHASPLPPSSQELKYYFTHQKMSISLHSTTLHIHTCPHPPRTTLSESEEWFYCGIGCKL